MEYLGCIVKGLGLLVKPMPEAIYLYKGHYYITEFPTSIC